MEENKIHYFEQAKTMQHREFIETHSNCALCGNVLELKHVIDKFENTIKEEAYCPQCSIRTRARDYHLN